MKDVLYSNDRCTMHQYQFRHVFERVSFDFYHLNEPNIRTKLDSLHAHGFECVSPLA